jgi:hypothetical protein
MLCQFADPFQGEGPGQFIGLHGVCVDSRADIYVGEVFYTVRGSPENPPREMRSFQKFIRHGQNGDTRTGPWRAPLRLVLPPGTPML